MYVPAQLAAALNLRKALPDQRLQGMPQLAIAPCAIAWHVKNTKQVFRF
jgi:hypothetical protein